jgi:hypothetical protein
MSRNEVATSDDLVSAVEGALRRSGAYRKIKAQLRESVFHALEDKTVPMPEKPMNVFLATELVRDFLVRFKLNNTLSVFCEEMGQTEATDVDRGLMGDELGLDVLSSDENMPLLLLFVQHMKTQRAEFLHQVCSSMNLHTEAEETGNKLS